MITRNKEGVIRGNDLFDLFDVEGSVIFVESRVHNCQFKEASVTTYSTIKLERHV